MKEYSIKIKNCSDDWSLTISSGKKNHLSGVSNLDAVLDQVRQFILDSEKNVSLFFASDGRYFNKNNQTNPILDMRTHGEYAGKAFYLDDSFDWYVKRDNQGLLVLVPERK